jgi:hypothetical protein
MTNHNREFDASTKHQAMMRKPRRITITLPWSLYQTLVLESSLQGRSLSNLASFWLERYWESNSGGDA